MTSRGTSDSPATKPGVASVAGGRYPGRSALVVDTTNWSRRLVRPMALSWNGSWVVMPSRVRIPPTPPHKNGLLDGSPFLFSRLISRVWCVWSWESIGLSNKTRVFKIMKSDLH